MKKLILILTTFSFFFIACPGEKEDPPIDPKFMGVVLPSLVAASYPSVPATGCSNPDSTPTLVPNVETRVDDPIPGTYYFFIVKGNEIPNQIGGGYSLTIQSYAAPIEVYVAYQSRPVTTYELLFKRQFFENAAMPFSGFNGDGYYASMEVGKYRCFIIYRPPGNGGTFGLLIEDH
ncbi:hypothetical protein V6Z05_06160 [Leptospira venezuelensis]|uniref:hypothetical protein n=1 Tax=Leptospira venezuelensis TaxID=1958811 RepID=UPI0012FF8366|nr:hypothetical protein [Leptospira venezuelensis]